MGSACLPKGKLGVLPDHIRPAAEPGAAPAAHCRNSSYSLESREPSQEPLLAAAAAGLNVWMGEGAISRGATAALALL